MIVYLAVVILLLIPGVQATKPLPDFSANVTSGNAPLTVSFTDLSSNNPTGWAWYFGDENYSVPWTEVTPDSGYPASDHPEHSCDAGREYYPDGWL